MTFASIPSAAAIFLDANTLIYHFGNDPTNGPACTQLLKRIELGDLSGFTSAHALADVAHRLMTLEVIMGTGTEHRVRRLIVRGKIACNLRWSKLWL